MQRHRLHVQNAESYLATLKSRSEHGRNASGVQEMAGREPFAPTCDSVSGHPGRMEVDLSYVGWTHCLLDTEKWTLTHNKMLFHRDLPRKVWRSFLTKIQSKAQYNSQGLTYSGIVVANSMSKKMIYGLLQRKFKMPSLKYPDPPEDTLKFIVIDVLPKEGALHMACIPWTERVGLYIPKCFYTSVLISVQELTSTKSALATLQVDLKTGEYALIPKLTKGIVKCFAPPNLLYLEDESTTPIKIPKHIMDYHCTPNPGDCVHFNTSRWLVEQD
jgi:hypothetical protein